MTSWRRFLPFTVLFLVAGFVVGPGWLGIVHPDPRSDLVSALATVALIVILCRDGLEVDAEMLQREWRPPLRKLVVGMPITGAIVAVATKTLTDLSWTESFLVGALLSPTDPVLSNAVVTNPRVPRVVRHSLNLESGLNDGLALAPILALATALDATRHHFDPLAFVVQDVGLGFAFGIACGLLASLVTPRTAAHAAFMGVGLAFAAYGATQLGPEANGFIAVYVAAIVLGVRRPDLLRDVERRADQLVEIVKLGIFVVFGALLTFGGLFDDGWAAVAIVAVTLLVARPVAVFVSLAGTSFGRHTKAFMSWFGPKGVSTMAFSLIVLSRHIAAGERIFHLAALCVVCSIIAHGSTDTAGVRWLERRLP
ncbi:MAG TPA: cation:proton antiporter [Solirubrobacteraceae bacterium]